MPWRATQGTEGPETLASIIITRSISPSNRQQLDNTRYYIKDPLQYHKYIHIFHDFHIAYSHNHDHFVSTCAFKATTILLLAHCPYPGGNVTVSNPWFCGCWCCAWYAAACNICLCTCACACARACACATCACVGYIGCMGCTYACCCCGGCWTC